MTNNEGIQLGRAKNAVLTFLENRLIVPKIYLDADWGGQKVDALAIERDGVGDVHAVLLFAHRYLERGGLDDQHEWDMERQLLDQFKTIPAQYKYIGVTDTVSDRKRSPFNLVDRVNDESYSPDGLGRIGFLKLDVPADGEPEVKLEIKPERFRAKIAKLADEYIQQHEADWEIRA